MNTLRIRVWCLIASTMLLLNMLVPIAYAENQFGVTGLEGLRFECLYTLGEDGEKVFISDPSERPFVEFIDGYNCRYELNDEAAYLVAENRVAVTEYGFIPVYTFYIVGEHLQRAGLGFAESFSEVEYDIWFYRVDTQKYSQELQTNQGNTRKPEQSLEHITSGSAGDDAFWSFDSDGTLTISGSGEMDSYSYEASYDENEDYPRSNVPWEHLFEKIQKVVVEEGITSIGHYAFFDCPNLEEVILPNSLKTIWAGAFEETAIQELVIPEGVEYIGYYAFMLCDELHVLELPDSLLEIDGAAFKYCENLKEVHIPSNVKKIGGSCFEYVEKVYFYGDAPEICGDMLYIYRSFPNTAKVYYIEGKNGWTSPKWTSNVGEVYEAATFSPGKNAAEATPGHGDFFEMPEISDEEYAEKGIEAADLAGFRFECLYKWGEDGYNAFVTNVDERLFIEFAANGICHLDSFPNASYSIDDNGEVRVTKWVNKYGSEYLSELCVLKVEGDRLLILSINTDARSDDFAFELYRVGSEEYNRLCEFDSIDDAQPSLSVDAGLENGLFADVNGGRGMDINVTSNVAWQAKVIQGSEWITLSTTGGNGNGTFYTITAANHGAERRGTIEVSANGCETLKIPVVQAGVQAKLVPSVDGATEATVNVPSTYQVHADGAVRYVQYLNGKKTNEYDAQSAGTQIPLTFMQTGRFLLQFSAVYADGDESEKSERLIVSVAEQTVEAPAAPMVTADRYSITAGESVHFTIIAEPGSTINMYQNNKLVAMADEVVTVGSSGQIVVDYTFDSKARVYVTFKANKNNVESSASQGMAIAVTESVSAGVPQILQAGLVSGSQYRTGNRYGFTADYTFWATSSLQTDEVYVYLDGALLNNGQPLSASIAENLDDNTRRFKMTISISEGEHTIAFSTADGTSTKSTVFCGIKQIASTRKYAQVDGGELRSWPSLGANVAASLEQGDEVEVRGEVTINRAKYDYVKYNCNNYFMRKGQLTSTKPLADDSGYRIAVVIDGQEIVCDRYCFSPDLMSEYFGLRAYYNGESVNTNGVNATHSFVFSENHQKDDYLCPMDFSINPETGYHKGIHKEYWLLQKIDEYTFRFNRGINDKGVVKLVDSSGNELAMIQLVVRPDGRYVSGEDAKYNPDEPLHDYEVLLPENAYTFWDTASAAEKKLWFKLAANQSIDLSSPYLDAFDEMYSSDIGLRASVAAWEGANRTIKLVDSTLAVPLAGYGEQLKNAYISAKEGDYRQFAYYTLLPMWQQKESLEAMGDALTDAQNTFVGIWAGKNQLAAKNVAEGLMRHFADINAAEEIVNKQRYDIYSAAAGFVKDVLAAYNAGVAEDLQKAIDSAKTKYGYDFIIKEVKWDSPRGFQLDSLEDLREAKISLDEWVVVELNDLIEIETDEQLWNFKMWIEAQYGPGAGKFDFSPEAFNVKVRADAAERIVQRMIKNTKSYKERLYIKLCQHWDKIEWGIDGVAAVFAGWMAYDSSRVQIEKWADLLTETEDFLNALAKSDANINKELINDVLDLLVEAAAEKMIAPLVEGVNTTIKELGKAALSRKLPTNIASILGRVTKAAPHPAIIASEVMLGVVVSLNEDGKGAVWGWEDMYDMYLEAEKNLEDLLNEYQASPQGLHDDIMVSYAYYQILRYTAVEIEHKILVNNAQYCFKNFWLSAFGYEAAMENALDAVFEEYNMELDRIEELDASLAGN